MFNTKIIPFIMYALFFIQCSTPNKENILNAPENWKSEIIAFPLTFAPSLPYSGEVHVRFAPGWGKEEASDYFSYAFLWNINEDPQLSSEKLEQEMEIYFDGLMKKEGFKTKAFFEKLNETTYLGKIFTFDGFTTQKKVTLDVRLDYAFCNATNKHTILFNMSPQKPEHKIWKKLNKIIPNIECQ